MHRIYLLCLLLLFTPTLYGQNWHPFPGGATYVYTFDNPNNLRSELFGLHLDSVYAQGADSIYVFNRTVRQNINLAGPNCGHLLFLDNQDHLLGKEMRLQPDGRCVFYTSAGDSAVLLTQATPGSSWSYLPTVSAQVDSTVYGMVLGQQDSLKYIHLSNNHRVILSKSFGLVALPGLLPFQLANPLTDTVRMNIWGIPGLQVGDTLPGAMGVFDYDLGDYFGYREEYNPDVVGGGIGTRTTYTHFEILSNQNQWPNLYSYGTEKEKIVILNVPPSPTTTYTAPHASTVSGQLRDYWFLDRLPYASNVYGIQGQTGMTDTINVGAYVDGNGKVILEFQDWMGLDTCGGGGWAMGLRMRSFTFKQNHGRVSFHEQKYPYDLREWQYCFHKADEPATGCQNLVALPIEDAAPQPALELWPVPAQAALQLRMPEAGAALPWQVEVLNLQGQVVHHCELAADGSIRRVDCSAWPAGMYLVRWGEEGHWLGQQRISVQR